MRSISSSNQSTHIGKGSLIPHSPASPAERLRYWLSLFNNDLHIHNYSSTQDRTCRFYSGGTTKFHLDATGYVNAGIGFKVGGDAASGKILRAAGGYFAAADLPTRQLVFELGDGVSVIPAGTQKWVQLPCAGTILSWTILADLSGSIVIDVWKDTLANYPPTAADTITASAKPTLSSADHATSSVLTGWTTAFAAGDVLKVNVDSCSTIKKAFLIVNIAV